MATKRYKLQPIMLRPKQIDWLADYACKLTIKMDRFISMSEAIRMMILAQQEKNGKVS